MTSHAAAVFALTNGTVVAEYSRSPRGRFTDVTARCTLCHRLLVEGHAQPTARIYDVFELDATKPAYVAMRKLVDGVRRCACTCAWSRRC
jgi:hypothetical protein